MAPRDLQKVSFSSVPAVMKMFGAEAAALSWMPAMETEEAPACQRMEFPELNEPMRYMAWSAVIHV